MLRSAVLSLLLVGCGDPPAPAELAPIEAPDRNAAGDASLRRMVMDMAEHQACGALTDSFVPLPESNAPRARRPRVEGRLWISDCRVERVEEALRITLGGRGWQWADEVGAGPLGSSFSVRGTVRFEAAITLEGEVDLRYDADTRRAQVIVTPRPGQRVRVTPIGAVPVAPSGGWSSIIGGIGGLFGLSPQAQAREQLEAQAAARMRNELSRGLTVSFDLCTGQVDATLGALAEGEAPPAPPMPGSRWLDNQATLVLPHGLDVAGPFSPDDGALRFELERVEGPPVDARLACARDVALMTSSFLSSGEARLGPALDAGQVSQRLVLDETASCDAVHLVLIGADTRSLVRYRVTRESDEAAALVDCD